MAIVDAAYADNYIATERYGTTAFSGLTTDEKNKVLAMAENQLATEYTLDSGDDAHKNAIVEQALMIVDEPESQARASIQSQGVTAAGIVKETYKDGAAGIAFCAFAQSVLGKDPDDGADMFGSIMERDDSLTG